MTKIVQKPEDSKPAQESGQNEAEAQEQKQEVKQPTQQNPGPAPRDDATRDELIHGDTVERRDFQKNVPQDFDPTVEDHKRIRRMIHGE